MQKKIKKIIIIICASILLLLTLPTIVDYANQKDMEKLEQILSTH